jgi:hypothetical protein
VLGSGVHWWLSHERHRNRCCMMPFFVPIIAVSVNAFPPQRVHVRWGAVAVWSIEYSRSRDRSMREGIRFKSELRPLAKIKLGQ